jgi:hypothetical protein
MSTARRRLEPALTIWWRSASALATNAPTGAGADDQDFHVLSLRRIAPDDRGDDFGLHRVGDETFLVRLVMQRRDVGVARALVAGEHDARVERDLGDHEPALSVLAHLPGRGIFVRIDAEPGARCEVEEEQHVARRQAGDESLLGIHRRGNGMARHHQGRG